MTDHRGEPLLCVESLSKHYGAIAAISGLSFVVQPREVLGICGPNGAGKTTLFDIVSGVTASSEGKILFKGRDVTALSAAEMCHRGAVRTFQLNAVFDTMSVRDNLLSSAYFGSRRIVFPGLSFGRALHAKVEGVAEAVRLADVLDVRAGDLPVLQRKLLMLGSALACDPSLLLLDEPVGGLSAVEIGTCVDIFKEVQKDRGIAIAVIEHVMSFMTAVADRIMILHQGKKLYEGPADSLASNPEVVSIYLGSSAVVPRAGGTPRRASP